MNRYDVFISYNLAQVAWIRRLVKKLRNHGLRPFFDKDVGLAGVALSRAIAESMLASKCCVVVLTPEAVDSKWVGYEIQRALKLDPDSTRRFVIPLLLRDCNVPLELDAIGYIDCRKGLTQRKLAELVGAIAQRGAANFVGGVRPSDPWRLCYAPIDVDLSELAFLDQLRGMMVGDRGTVLQTVNGGRTWDKQESPVTQNLYSVAFRGDGENGWIVGASAVVLRTDDGGTTWTPVACGIDEDLLAVRYCDGGEGICVVTSAGSILRRGLRSTQWNRIRIDGQPALWSIDFSLDGRLGCAVGANGTILLSQDGGRNWKRKATRIRPPLYSATVLADGRTICVVGDEGGILISRDGGGRWRNRSYRVKLWESWLNAADFSPDGKSGWVVGTKGLMLKTVDGGDSWTPFALDGEPELINVQYLSDGTIWVLGERGAVLTTRPL